MFARNANNVKASKSAIEHLQGEMHRDQQELKIMTERNVLLEEGNRSIQRNFERTKAKAAMHQQRPEIRSDILRKQLPSLI